MSGALEEKAHVAETSKTFLADVFLSSPFSCRTYFIVTPRIVRAGQVYRIVVNILETSPPLVVKATLFRDNIELESVERECEVETPQVLEIMVPPGSTHGQYRLRLEGNEIGWLTGSSFTNETDLTFSPEGATVLVQTDKPLYRQGDVVRFRVVALDTAVKMVDNAVDVFILNPRGVLVRRWLSRQCREGAVSLEFELSEEPEFGRWTIRVEATNSFTQHTFSVEYFNQPRFEVEVQTPAFVSAMSDYLEGTVMANYSSGAPVAGNVTVRAAVRPLSHLSSPRYASFGPDPSIVQYHRVPTGQTPTVEELSVCYLKEFNDNGTFSSGVWYRVSNRSTHLFAGVFNFKFRMADFEDLVPHTEGTEIRVTATVGDAYWDATETGFSATRIYSSALRLSFLGDSPHVFRPAMPFKFYLSATQHDGSRVPDWRLARHRLLVTPEIMYRSGQRRRLDPRTVKMTHAEFALWEAEFDLHTETGNDVNEDQDVAWVKLEAELKESMGSRAFASSVVVAHYSPKGRHLQVTTSTRNPKVGEYIILHVRSNFYVDKFRYVILSKGMVLEAGQQSIEASLKTFPVPLTANMAGVATVVVYSLDRSGDIVADALTFPVDGLTRKGLQVTLRQVLAPEPNFKYSSTTKESSHHRHHHHRESLLSITVTGDPGSFVALAGVDWLSYSMQAGNDLTPAMIMAEMSRYEHGSQQAPLGQTWVSQEGLPDQVLHLPRASPGVDANSTFEYSDLLVVSDGFVASVASSCGDVSGSRRPCLSHGCYNAAHGCDGKWDCIDGTDEKGCQSPDTDQETLEQFRQYRQSRLPRHFKEPWLWNQITLGESGVATMEVPIPKGVSHLTLSAFSLHPNRGLTLLPQPVQWKGSPGFWLSVEAPSRVGLWEQVGVRVTTVNHLSYTVTAIIVLANNPAYRFVSVEGFNVGDIPGGLMGGPVRRMVRGEHEHSVDVEAGETHTLYLPIVPVELGKATIIVQASLPGRKLQEEVTVLVEPMGAHQELHTSLLLDLSNRAYFFTFLDVNVSDHHVPGSVSAHISVFGDTVSPALPSNPVTSDSLLGLPMVGCEPVVFSFLLTVLEIRHAKEERQNPSPNERLLFSHLAQIYQTILAHQNRDGGFKYYRTSQTSSVWVTALVVRALNEVSTQWPHYLYIDPQVSDRAIRFLLSQQASHGAWWEPDGMIGDRNLIPSPYTLTQENTHALNLSITAHTILNLLSLKELPMPLDEKVLLAVASGVRWLEDNIKLVGRASRPLEVALVTLALHYTDSTRKDAAFAILARHARQEMLTYRQKWMAKVLKTSAEGVSDQSAKVTYIYWGEDLVPLPAYRVESQRPHLQPRIPHRHDTANVAATALALRVYVARGEEMMTPAIVRWLHSQRSKDGGWMSTRDTLLAWEALHEYSKKTKTAQRTHLTLTIEPLHTHNFARTFYITPDNFLTLQTNKVEADWGSVRVQGKGKGSAVLQLTSKFHVSDERFLITPPTQAFRLRTKAAWHGRNASSITYNTCVRWTYKETSEESGVAVLEVGVPTGYSPAPGHLNEYVASRKLPTLRRGDFIGGKVIFYFDQIGSVRDTCVRFSVERWFPVANLTKILPVKVYEYYTPDLYAEELVDMSSVTLDICQVCGSYQCPNCPVLSYYSSKAYTPAPSTILFLSLLVTSIFSSVFCLSHR
ncbi:CD109 antigen-like [Oratosquilla oratoria]|uniref:CD109 antigen-like n=1 Tax=Oratosquilla oratoria TaxID=337810 RepID=UPI003F776C17